MKSSRSNRSGVWRRARARHVCDGCRGQIGAGDRCSWDGVLLCESCGRDHEAIGAHVYANKALAALVAAGS